MFHKIKTVNPLSDYRLSILFSEGVTKIYDVKPLFDRLPAFRRLVDEPELFYEVSVDVGGCGIVWNDDIDLACDELFTNGIQVDTPFDNLMSFGDATELWGLNESTLRKAVEYGRLINGVDVCKYGKQWIITMDAMRREYGEPKK